MSIITDDFEDIFFGSCADALEILAKTPADKVVMITLKDDDPKALVKWQTIKTTAESSPTKAKNFIHEGMILNRAKKALFTSEDWLESKDIGSLASFSPINSRAEIHKWKQRGRIFSIKHESVEYYPAYALNPENGYRPYNEIVDIIDAFGGMGNSWKLAFWFDAKNSYLAGQAPKDLIAKKPKAVVDAAIIQGKRIQHG